MVLTRLFNMTLTRLLDNSDGYIIGRSPEVLVTRGMGLCAGIAVYEPRTGVGVLGHFAVPYESECFGGMMRWIPANLRPSGLEVVLAGISLDTQATNNGGEAVLNMLNRYRLYRREQLVLALQKIGVRSNQIRQMFSEPDMVSDMMLDTSNGEVTIKHKSVEHVFDYHNASL